MIACHMRGSHIMTPCRMITKQKIGEGQDKGQQVVIRKVEDGQKTLPRNVWAPLGCHLTSEAQKNYFFLKYLWHSKWCNIVSLSIFLPFWTPFWALRWVIKGVLRLRFPIILRRLQRQTEEARFSGCSIRGFDEKMKCSKTYQNELKTCQNECEYYSEKESASEMPWKPCFIRVLMICGYFLARLLFKKSKMCSPNRSWL